MSFWSRVGRSNFFIKLKSWEYWPFGIVQFPLFFYFFWLSLRARSIVFFSATNPGIAMGGMFGESKFEILNMIPSQYIPKSILIAASSTPVEVQGILKDNNLQLPLIFKPDIGERGFMVKKITAFTDIEAYLKKIKIDFIAQEFISFPLEFGVFYTRFPAKASGHITSVVMKEMLTVTGDGHSSLKDLILKKDRAKLQWNLLQEVYQDKLDLVLPKDNVFELVSIGNHCLGTTFINRNDLINEKLSKQFDSISKQIDGFYFGRFDLRCNTLEDLYNGDIKIMELNGCGAEPAHIYQPGYSLFKAIRTLFKHWHNIFVIAKQNHKRGVRYITAKEALSYYQTFKAATATT